MKSRSLVNAVCLIGQPLLLNAISLPAMAYIIRALGATAYGQWMAASSLTAIAFVLASPGLRTLFVRRIAQEPDHAAESLGEQLGLRILLAFCASIAALLLCSALHYPRLVLTCVALTSVALTLFTISSALSDVLQGLERFRSTAAVNLAAGLALTAASVVAAWRGCGAVGMAIAYLTGPATSLALLLVTVQFTLFRVRVIWDFRRFGDLLREVKVLGAQNLLSAVQDRVEQILIPKLLGMTAFGYFSAGTMPASRLLLFPDGLATSYYPRISGCIREDHRRATSQVAQLMLLSLVVCVPLTILLVFLAGPLAAVLFPKSAGICRQIIQTTIWSLPLQAIAFPITYSLQAAGKHSQAARAGMFSTLCGSIVCLILINRLGIAGACVAWIVRPALLISFSLPSFIKVFPEVISRLPIRRICCCALLMAGLFWGVMSIGLPVFQATMLGSSLALILYGISLILLRVVEMAYLKQLILR